MNWSQYIEQDLERRLLLRESLPCKPTLERLAAHYGISTRPVRIALSRLKRKGVWPVNGQDHGSGITPGSEGDQSVTGGHRPPLLPPVDYYQQIGRELVARSLEGQERFIREQAMAARFAISTTAVREAFHRLAGDGIIEHVPRRGWRLRPLSQKDLDDFTAIREVLECMALRLSWDCLQSPQGRSQIQLFLDGNRLAEDQVSLPQVNDDFHGWIIRHSDNRFIIDFFERFGRYHRILFAWEGTDHRAAEQTVEQHRAILTAILAGDPTVAEAALVNHLRYQHPLLKQVMSKMKQEMNL